MPALTWANLVKEADVIGEDGSYREWTAEEREEWQDWVNVWNDSTNNTTDRILALKTSEYLEQVFDEGTPYKSLTGLYMYAYDKARLDSGLPANTVLPEDYNPFEEEHHPSPRGTHILREPEPRVAKPEPVEDTAKEPPLYEEDDFIIDWSQPVIFRGESRNGDGRLFYLYVPWGIVPGDQLRSFLNQNVGVAKGYKGMNGFKLGRGKYVRTLPLAGQVNKKPVSYIDRTIEALLANGAEKVQERRVVNTEELCTQPCQDAHHWTPCECCCGGEGHGGGSVLPGAEYTIYRGDLIIEGKRQIVWKIYE